MKIETQLVRLGRSSATQTNSVSPPLVRASTTLFSSLGDFKKSYDGLVFECAQYGRSGTGTTFELQTAMAKLENAETCIATASGLSAVVAVLSAYGGTGKHILVYDGVYGRTRTLCEKELRPLGVDIEFFNSADDLPQRIRPETSLVFIEVPSSLTMQMLDIVSICNSAHEKAVPVACDSTWGTPIYFKPHAIGIDISLHSATKYINGHCDLMLGLITGSYEIMEPIRAWCDHYGSHVSPDVCWLALRGLRTLAVRMPRHQESALMVAKWLQTQPLVKRLMFPALPGDEGHALWKKQFSGSSGLFSFEMSECDEEAFERFFDTLTLFGIGTSWGGFESLVMPAIPQHLRALRVQPDKGRLVRLHIGLANPEDLCDDLHHAFAAM